MKTLVEQLSEGCKQTPKRWSGDCGEESRVDERATDELMSKAATALWSALDRITHLLSENDRLNQKIRDLNERLSRTDK